MSEDLYRLISTGLLGAIVLLLLLAISQLSRLHQAVRAKPELTDAAPVEHQAPLDEETPSEIAPATTSESAGVTTDTEAVPVEEEGPFERDGRWWFRRDGELLVYDERLEQWVDPSAPAVEPAEAGSAPAAEATPEPAPAPHALDEARVWDEQHQADARAPVGQPVSTVAPIVEPVSAPAPITEVAPAAEQQDDGPGETAMTHWKCPACGVINGSTATSCRMCFAARP